MTRNLYLQRCLVWLSVGVTASAQTPAVMKADPQRAELAYVAGAKALDRRDLAGAQAEFARAAQLDPKRADYAMAMALTRDHRVSEMVQRAALLRMTDQAQQADELLTEARTIDPNNELVMEHAQATQQAGLQHTVVTPKFVYLPPVELQPTPGKQDLQLRGEPRQVVAGLAQTFGLKVVFDDSVSTGGQALRFDLQQTTYGQAMPILLRMAHLFSVPLDQQTLMVVKDSEENRTKFERLVEETVYIPGSTTEQMNELSNIVKNVFDVKQLVVSPGSGTIAMRAPAATVKAVNYTLADMIDGGGEVEMDLKLITVDKMVTRNVGIAPPTSASAFSAAAEVQSFVSTNQPLLATAISSGAFVPSGSAAQQLIESAAFLLFSGLATDARLTNVIRFFGNGLTLFGASIGGGATLNAALNTSDSRALDDITVRASSGQETTLRVGEKYPITTATYSSGVSSATASALAGVTVNGVSASSLLNQYLGSASTATIPQVQYEDLGITLKTTPRVLRSGLVSLHIDLKIEALTGASLDNIPVLTSSNFVSDITVQEGSSAIMLSNMTKSQAASVSGFPGLGELPGFQETLSNTTKTTDDSELVLLITPHVVRRRNNSTASRVYPFATSTPAEN